MTREEAKCIVANFELVKAFAEGEKIQAKTVNSEWACLDYPLFTLSPGNYRITPKSKLIPFTQDNFPADDWFKSPVFKIQCKCIQIEGNTVHLKGQDFDFKTLLNSGWQHSSDRKTWLPCGTEVVS